MLASAACSRAAAAASSDGLDERRALDPDREHGLARARRSAGRSGARCASTPRRRAHAASAVGRPAAPRRARGCWPRRGIGGDRPDEALPALAVGDEAGEVIAGGAQRLVVGDRRMHGGEVAADLFLGRPARRQADGEPRNRRRAPSMTAKSSAKARQSRAAARRGRGQAAQAGADRRIAVADGSSAAPAPSRQAWRGARAPSVVECRTRAGLLARRFAHQGAAAPARPRSQERRTEACARACAASTAIFSRRCRSPGSARRQLRACRDRSGAGPAASGTARSRARSRTASCR